MNLSITDDITFRKLTIFMTFMEKGNIARTAEALDISGVSVHRALHTLEENVRCPLFIHKGLFGTRPGIKVTVAVGNTGTEACVMRFNGQGCRDLFSSVRRSRQII